MRSVDASGPAAADDFAALRTWLAVRDPVLRGLVHALSNRVGTVIAAGGLLEAGSTAVAGQVLTGEADRLEALLEAFRILTADPVNGSDVPEPVVLGDAVRDALLVRAHGADARETEVALVGVDDAPPVVVIRAGLLHAIIVLLGGASVLRTEAAGNFVALRSEPPAAASAARAAVWLLASSGAQLGHDDALLVPRFGTAHAPAGAP